MSRLKYLMSLTLISTLFLSGCTAGDPITDDLYIRGDLYTWNGTAYQIVNTSLGGGGGGTGNVTGPVTSTDEGIARYDGVTGKIIQDSGVTIDNFDNLDTNGGDITGFDIHADNDVNVTNDLDVTDDADIGGDLTVVGSINATLVDGRDVSTDGAKLDATDDAEYLMRLIINAKGAIGIMPLYSNLTVTGSGGGWAGFGNNLLYTGTTYNSSASEFHLIPYTLSGNTDWTKKHIWIFKLACGDGSYDANTIARIQIKSSATGLGALAEPGFGFELLNTTWNMESYGTARNSTNFNLVQFGWLTTQVMIIHDPTVPKIEFYKTDLTTPFYTETTSNKIPQAGITVNAAVFCSVQNTAGTAQILIVPPLNYFIEYD